MGEECVSFKCVCGNKIEYTNYAVPGIRDPSNDIIICLKCKREHTISVDDEVINLKGATMKSWGVETAVCPFCDLETNGNPPITEEIAESIISSDHNNWCSIHLTVWFVVRGTTGLMGKPLVERIFRDAERESVLRP